MADPDTPLLIRGLTNPPGPIRQRTDEIMTRFSNWNPKDHKQFVGHTDEIWSCAISTDNHIIFSGSQDTNIIAWNNSGEQLYALKGHKATVRSLILTNQNTMLISADLNNNIFEWDIPNRRVINKLRGNTIELYHIAISNCGEYIASCGLGKEFDLWRTADWKHLGAISTESDCSNYLVFTPGEPKIILSCKAGELKLFSVNTPNKISQRSFCSYEIQCMAINQKSLIIGYQTYRIDLVKFSTSNNLEDFSNLKLFHTFTCFTNSIRSIAIMKEGSNFLAFSADQSIKVFNIPEKSFETKIDGCESFIFAGCLSRDNTMIVAGSSDGILRKWDIGERNRLRAQKFHQNEILTMAISNDDRKIATGTADGSIFFINIIENKSELTIPGNGKKIFALKFSPNGAYLASASEDNSVKLYKDEKLIHDFNNFHTKAVFCIAFSKDSKYLVSGSQDKQICVYNVEILDKINCWKAHFDSIFAVEVSLDGNYIVSGSSDYSVKIWELESGKFVYRIRSEYDEIKCLSFSPNNKFIAFGYKSGNITLFEWQIGLHPENPLKKIRSFNKHKRIVKYIHFSANNNIFVSCSFDLTIRIWRIDDYIQESIFLGQNSEICTAQFTNDMTKIISADKTSIIRQWTLNNDDLFDLADIRNAIETYLFLSFIKQGDSLKEKYIDYSFGHARINLAHFYAYLGYDELLLIALREGVEIKRDIDGKSPLHFAIMRKCQGCIDNILKFFGELKSQNFKKFLLYCHQIRDDFENLIINYSINLPKFLDDIFYATTIKQTFGKPLRELPIILYRDSRSVDLQEFIQGNELDGNSNGVNFRIYTIPFTIPYEMGSKDSLRFLQSIIDSNNQSIMATSFFKSYIKEKWDKIWYFILMNTIIYVLTLGLMVYLLIDYHYSSNNTFEINYWGQSIYILLNFIEFIHEIIQIYALGNSYRSFWNYIDSFRITFSLTWGIASFFVNQSNIFIVIILFLMVFFNLMRGITCFRIFDKTRYYIRLIKSAISDSIYFLLIFSYSTFAFGVLYFISADQNTSIASIWTAPYELNMGEVERANSENILTYIYFLLSSIINVIIMLNLLISILGDTFDSFQLNFDEVDNFEMAELINETESIMFWKQNVPAVKKYIQVCQEVIVKANSDWGGKIKHVAEMINDLKEDLNKKIDLMSKSIEDISTKLKDTRNPQIEAIIK